MPRRVRFNLRDVPQHIIQRGNNRQATFFVEEDYRFYLDRLLEASRKYQCSIYAYVLMTNHAHLDSRHGQQRLAAGKRPV
jgi:putative transposase